MALDQNNFTTGPAPKLFDTSLLYYNGCDFSPLFQTQVSGQAIKDNAHRTVKFMEYAIKVDGYVTLPVGEDTVSGRMDNLRALLTAQGGELRYQGRGMDLVVNVPQAVGGAIGVRDVAWGPVPELLDFQPLGAGRSAKVVWQVKARIPEGAFRRGVGNVLVRVGGVVAQLLQFNYETSVKYDEAGYSSQSIKGTLEIPLTRATQPDRTVRITADNFRSEVERRVLASIDLSRFRLTGREFQVSRDKRTLEWSVDTEEKGYMDLPPDSAVAHGVYSVRPAKQGMGLATWLCTLRSTYYVRADRPRRFGWFAFLALLRRRIIESRHGNVPKVGGEQNPKKGVQGVLGAPNILGTGFALWKAIFGAQGKVGVGKKAWLIDFSFEEGVYLGSRTISFSATWRLNTTFSHILLASGLWTKVPEEDSTGKNLWAMSVKDISGQQSWLQNRLNPDLDVIVDFGGG